jgi:ATP-binding cassette subfamily B protein
MSSTATPAPTAPLIRLWRYASGYRKRILLATTWSFLNKAVDIAPPFLIGMAIDVVVNGSDSLLGGFGIEDEKQQIIVIALLSFIIWTLESIFEYLLGIEWRNLAQSIEHDLRVETYAHVQELDMRFFEDRSTGDLMAVLNDDVNQLERFLDVGANEVIQVVTTVVLIGAAFFVIAPSAAWLAFLPIPVILWGSFLFQKKIEPRYALVREKAAAINSQLNNSIGGISTIKAFTAWGPTASSLNKGHLLIAVECANRRSPNDHLSQPPAHPDPERPRPAYPGLADHTNGGLEPTEAVSPSLRWHEPSE